MTRSLFTVVGSAVRPALAGTLVSQALTERAKLLLQELEERDASVSSRDLAKQLVQGLKFLCEVAMDTIPFAFQGFRLCGGFVPPCVAEILVG